MLEMLALTLASATFKADGAMPPRTTFTQCGGINVSPELHWRGAPKRTRSFAILTRDADAPHKGAFYHWVVYNLPASTHELVEGATLPPSELGDTAFGSPGYAGPCPQPGKPHRYRFTLYALNVPHISGNALNGPQLERAMRGHVLGQRTLTGVY